jgi:hypothetical protein
MMPQAVLSIRGKRSEWGITTPLPQATIDAMIEDGIEVGILENSVPEWAVNGGLLRLWCFFQDIWNLRNPFRQ